ncbi:mercuric transporter MerT family protein [Thiothrix winogradskyi]|uniref:Mercuric transport protein MerT n=1 Tax=Thiothrix winogradskyi TaxID=96472 RepID=A0ABY3T474_9GAMM|nr:mercuric transporter MerT family protein [Thiothrix winogradskyi]UJS26371.1 mercury transporter MerT [Thiothrix winogradskyi]
MKFDEKTSLIASVLAAVGASVCCVGPLVLLALGISGAWISHLTLMEPFRPLFIGLTLLFLALTFYRLYWRPRQCVIGAACADSNVLRRQRWLFWLVTVALLALLAVPLIAPWFY